MDWIVTVPKIISWNMYKKELDAVKDGKLAMNYKVPYKPKVQPGEKLYILHDGMVRGYMYITGIRKKEGFVCSTTGKEWNPGWYVQRSGEFYPLTPPIPMKGFRGLRRFNEGEINT